MALKLQELIKEVPNLVIILAIATSLSKTVKYTYSFILARRLLIQKGEEPEEIVFFGFRWIRKHTPSNNGQSKDMLKKGTKDKQDKDK